MGAIGPIFYGRNMGGSCQSGGILLCEWVVVVTLQVVVVVTAAAAAMVVMVPPQQLVGALVGAPELRW